MLYVLAGNYREHSNFIRNHNLRNGHDARYIHDERTYMGHRGGKFIRIGTYWDREENRKAFHMLKSNGCQEIISMVQLTVSNLLILFNSEQSYIRQLDTD
jgi:hypothetical protein